MNKCKWTGLNNLMVSDFVEHLQFVTYSGFPLNLYLSSVKQLAAWRICKRGKLKLVKDQFNVFWGIGDICGLAIELTFYKDSLEQAVQDVLMTCVDYPAIRLNWAFRVCMGAVQSVWQSS